MVTFLVTGGAGFIGSHLCEFLLNSGNRVINIDNMNNFYDPKLKEINLFEIQDNIKENYLKKDHYIFYKCDIRDRVFIDGILRNHKIDCIIHLAGNAGVRPSIKNPQAYIDNNIAGTGILLEAARSNKINKFIYASSSSVYGNNSKVPFSESDKANSPISPYAATKKACELLCYTYSHLYKIRFACLRFFTVYGPRQRPDLAIHKFTKFIQTNKKIPFYGDGTSRRDFTYISDIIAGINGAVKWLFKENSYYEIFNLGGSNTISLNELIRKLETIIGKKAHYQYFPFQPGDMHTTYADISKSRSLLGYKPKINMDQGLERFVKWYSELNIYRRF